MKKLCVLWMLLAALFVSAAGAAQDEGVIVQRSCNIVPSGEYYLVHCFAQVHNNTDQVICLDQGTFELHNGEQLLSSNEVSQIWPYFIGPGEDGYLFDIVAFEPTEDGAAVMPTVTGIVYDIEYMTVDQAYDNYDLITQYEIEKDETGEAVTVVCEITNPTQIDAFDLTVAYGLYTDTGMMLYADGMTLKNVGIPAGGTTLVRFAIDRVFLEQWKSFGAEPAQAAVTAVFRKDED